MAKPPQEKLCTGTVSSQVLKHGTNDNISWIKWMR